MKNISKTVPFIVVLGYIIYQTVSGWDRLNWVKTVAFILAFVLTAYFIFIVLTESYIDFRDGFKIKKAENSDSET